MQRPEHNAAAMSRHAMSGIIAIGLSVAALIFCSTEVVAQGEKQKQISPYVRAATDCYAVAIEINITALDQARRDQWCDAINTIGTACDAPLIAMTRRYDEIYGASKGRRFLSGPFREGLPRALRAKLGGKLAGTLSSEPRSARSIELTDVIQLYMIPVDATYNVLEWRVGSEPGTPIRWEHAGAKPCQDDVDKEFALYSCRTGRVFLTVRGKPTHTFLDTTVRPAEWKIVLVGPRAGVQHVAIDSDVLSQELSGGMFRAALRNPISIQRIRKCGGDSFGAELYRVNSPNRLPAYVQESVSCGSGGCSVSLLLSYDEGEAQRLMKSDGSC